jgi:hypothetical protein
MESFVWKSDDKNRIHVFANLTADEIMEKPNKKNNYETNYVFENVCEYADHHVSEKGMPRPKVMFHAKKHGYVTIKDTKDEQCLCEVQEPPETVSLPRNELSASIQLVIRIATNKDEEGVQDSFIKVNVEVNAPIEKQLKDLNVADCMKFDYLLLKTK